MGSEATYHGIAVSPGVAVGQVFVARPRRAEVPERAIAPDEVPAEMRRLREALDRTKSELMVIRQRVANELGPDHAKIFDVQVGICDDPLIYDETEERVRSRLRNVESVFREIMMRYLRVIAGLEDELFMERHNDVRDVMERILGNLADRSHPDLGELPFGAVVIAHDLAPSDMAAIPKGRILGLAIDMGSRTSHTVIMAQSLGIPAVVGLHDVSSKLTRDARVIVDGTRGLLIVEPSPETLRRYEEEVFRLRILDQELVGLRDLPAETLDGHRLILSANIETPDEVPLLKQHGAQGIGLYRTEYLYMNREDLPSEQEQYEAYSQILREVSPDPVIIRTFDLGGDKFVSQLDIPFELNPFLGWRAIRFCLERLDVFKAQLRAILRAGVHGQLKLMFPMISSVTEVVRAIEVTEETREELRAENIPCAEGFEIGVMIEVPSAALTADIIAQHVDFFSIGTNDLIQYTLAVERTNDKIAHLYQPCHPGVLRLLKRVIDEGHRRGIWVGMCGEMAAEAPMTLLLLGMGLDEMSVHPSAVPRIKKVIRRFSRQEAQTFASEMLDSDSADTIRTEAYRRLRERLPELVGPEGENE